MDTNYFNCRRTVRKYSSQPVSIELIETLLAEATHAPTTGNMQLYSAVVTTQKEIKERLSPCHFNQPQVMDAPIVITFCADFNRFIKWCQASNAKPGYDNFQSFMTAVLDTCIFAQQFNTIAELHGLGCCYLGTTTYNAPQIADALNLPEFVVPVTTLTVGYPDGSSPCSERLPIHGIVHRETYHDYAQESISSIYAEKESLAINKQYVAENKKETLAQVFTDVRYTKQNNETFSEIYYKFIESQGFPFPG